MGKLAVILVIVLTLVACASAPVRGVDFYRGGDNGPKLERDFAECRYEANKHSNVGGGFGMVGAAMAGAQMRNVMEQCMSLRGYSPK